MGRKCLQLIADERNLLQRGLNQGVGLKAMATLVVSQTLNPPIHPKKCRAFSEILSCWRSCSGFLRRAEQVLQGREKAAAISAYVGNPAGGTPLGRYRLPTPQKGRLTHLFLSNPARLHRIHRQVPSLHV
jgi:hypothetical protein